MRDPGLKVGVQDDLILVMDRRTLFYAIFAKALDPLHLVLLRRRPGSDRELVARARDLAVAKAIEIGWIEEPDAPAMQKDQNPDNSEPVGSPLTLPQRARPPSPGTKRAPAEADALVKPGCLLHMRGVISFSSPPPP
jgi:hypothetical protein